MRTKYNVVQLTTMRFQHFDNIVLFFSAAYYHHSYGQCCDHKRLRYTVTLQCNMKIEQSYSGKELN